VATYVVATKREARSDGISAAERIRGAPGIEVKGAGNDDRLVIEASPESASELRRRFADKLIIEPEILHHPLRSQDAE
jgi:hypothetical protein